MLLLLLILFFLWHNSTMPKFTSLILESKFQDKVKAFLINQGCELAHLKTRNWPDLLVCPPKTPAFFLELKRDSRNKYKPTDGQLEVISKLTALGHVAIFLYHDDDWKTILSKLLLPNNSTPSPENTEPEPIEPDNFTLL